MALAAWPRQSRAIMSGHSLEMRFARDPAADDQPLNIRRAFMDLADAYIAIDAFDAKVAQVAVAAMRLDGLGAHPLGHLRGKQLGHRRFLEARLAGIAQAC